MANQMIALGVRGPQLPDVGAINARYANIMANTAVAREKQVAAQRANAFRQLVSSPDFDPYNPENIKAAAALDPEGAAKIAQSFDTRRKAEQTYAVEQIKRLRDFGAAVADEKGYQAWLGEVEKASPAEAAAFRQFSPNFDPDKMNRILMTADQYISRVMPTVKTESIIGEGGDVGVLTSGGFGAPTITTPKTYRPGGGVGGPKEPAPTVTSGNDAAGVASVLANVANDAEYQTVLNTIDSQNPQVAAAIRQAMPRFDPQRMAGIRAAAAQEFGRAGAPSQVSLVAGERGGMGGPLEGYVEAPQPFRARVPAPPVGPQPRETAEEVYQKEKARLRAQTEAGPKPLTAPQEAKLRSNIAKDYKSARSTIEMMDGVSRAVNDVRNLSPDQKEAITGFSGYAPSILPSSRSADTKLKNLQGKVTEMGKAAASLTGAIGQMAVQEWRIVSDMIASLDVTGMEPADLDNQLDIIEGQAKRAASITRDAYENQYVEDFARYPNRFQLPEPSAAAPKAAPRGGKNYPVLTPDQVRKAPKGTTFRTTDGRLMRKN